MIQTGGEKSIIGERRRKEIRSGHRVLATMLKGMIVITIDIYTISNRAWVYYLNLD